MPPPELVEFEDLGRVLSHARRRVWNAVARVLAAQHQPMLGWAVVSWLARSGPLSQRDLADLIGQHPAGVSRQLTELDRAGLTTRTRDPLDRRRRLVTLTARGRRWHRLWHPTVLGAVRDVLGVLDAAERAQLRDLLRKVLAPRVVKPARVSGRASRATVR